MAFTHGGAIHLGSDQVAGGLLILLCQRPEPGVGAMTEVRDKTLAYEDRLTWRDKLPKLFWKGALLVDLRRVSCRFLLPLEVFMTDKVRRSSWIWLQGSLGRRLGI